MWNTHGFNRATVVFTATNWVATDPPSLNRVLYIIKLLWRIPFPMHHLMFGWLSHTALSFFKLSEILKSYLKFPKRNIFVISPLNSKRKKRPIISPSKYKSPGANSRELRSNTK